MSNYVVTDAQLEDVADAIRAKSGSENPLAFPADFISEIGSIETGGGGMTLLAEHHVTESEVTAMQIDYTSEMSDYDLFCMEVEGSCTGSAYICPQINATNSNQYYENPPANQQFLRRYIVAPIYNVQSNSVNGYGIPINYLANSVTSAAHPLSFFYVRTYYASTFFNIGTAFRVYGVKL